MAQTGFTPISLYYTTTAAAVPTAGNLVAGELAINTNDGKLFYKDSAGVVQVIAGKGGAGVAGGSNTQVQYNSSGSLAGSANMTFSGTALTLANDASISGLTVGKGGGAVASATVVGAGAMAATNTGAANSAFGGSALAANTSGYYNSAFGYLSSAGNTTGNGNSSFGRASLYTNTTGASNTAIGQDSLFSNTTASNNTAVGYQAGYSNTTATRNTYTGYQSGYASVTGARNSGFGHQALYANTGTDNCAFGDGSLPANTSGVSNSAFGGGALNTNTTGSYNVGVGTVSLVANTTGSNNIGIGYFALANNSTASNNTALGYQAGYSCTVSPRNTFIGGLAGYTFNATAGGNGYNTLVGYRAGYSLTTGYGNTFIGTNNGTGLGSGDLMTTGNNNSILGAFNGNSGGLDIRTASNYIVLSDGDGNPRIVADNAGNVLIGQTATSGAGFEVTVAGEVEYLNRNTVADGVITRFRKQGSTVGYISTNTYSLPSDLRIKKDVKDIEYGLSFISSLRPVQYNTVFQDPANQAKKNFGLIAQEVEETLNSFGKSVNDVTFLEKFEEYKEGESQYGLGYQNLVPVLIKAIQELKAEVDSLKQQLGK